MNPLRLMEPHELMAANFYGEARSKEDALLDERKEWCAIGWTVLNRANDPYRWANNPKDVILQPYQFSWTRTVDPSYERAIRFIKQANHPLYDEMILWAKQVLKGKVVDCSNGANHYVARWLYESKNGWWRDMTVTAMYGGHVFLTDKKLLDKV